MNSTPDISGPDERFVFLDVDGVINHFRLDDSGCVGPFCRPECMVQLNRIMEAARPWVVISSTWRRLVLDGSMTVQGFAILLHTHGFQWGSRIVGTTDAGRLDDRGSQIRRWWHRHVHRDARYVALDDMDLGMSRHRIPLVQTDGRFGLTAEDADRAISILGGRRDGA